MPQLTFNLFCGSHRYESRQVTIYPPHVESVVETERQPDSGFYQKVAVITTISGEKFTVEDEGRNVAVQIYEALRIPTEEAA